MLLGSTASKPFCFQTNDFPTLAGACADQHARRAQNSLAVGVAAWTTCAMVCRHFGRWRLAIAGRGGWVEHFILRLDALDTIAPQCFQGTRRVASMLPMKLAT